MATRKPIVLNSGELQQLQSGDTLENASLDATLEAMAGVTTAADTGIYFTGVDVAAAFTLTAFARTLVDDASASDARSTLGLVIGTHVQMQDAQLQAIAELSPAANQIPYFTSLTTADLLDFKDEDDMASDSATAIPSQQSVKAYVDDAVASAGGGAWVFPYTFDDSTTDSDPGAGIFRLNNATQNTATELYVDLLDANAVDLTNAFDALGSVGSLANAVAILRIVHRTDPSKWLLFRVFAIVSETGYRRLVLDETFASSAASPFADGDPVYLVATQNGEQGATGTSGTPGTDASIPDVQIFTSDGTWTKPMGAVEVDVHLIGGGGGGGSGRKGAAGGVRCGGAGGGGGGYAMSTIAAGSLSGTEAVRIGAGGTAGANVTADSTNGSAGGAGGDTEFGPNGSEHVIATGGGGGGGGTNAAATGGTGGSGTINTGSGTTASGGNGASSVTTNFASNGGSPSNRMAGAGGGAGGGLDAADARLFSSGGGNSGGGGSPRGIENPNSLTGGIASLPPDRGGDGIGVFTGSAPLLFGGGGSGGGSTATPTAANFPAFNSYSQPGGSYGGGGGGGAALINGHTLTFNPGGLGTQGLAIIVTRFV